MHKCPECNINMEYQVGIWICLNCDYQTTFDDEGC